MTLVSLGISSNGIRMRMVLKIFHLLRKQQMVNDASGWGCERAVDSVESKPAISR